MKRALIAALRSLPGPFRKKEGSPSGSDAGADSLFREKYHAFQELLDSNSELLKVISDIETHLGGAELFGMSFLRSRASRAIFHALRMVKSFERLSGRPCPVLTSRVEEVRDAVKDLLDASPPAGLPDLVLPIARLDASMTETAGGKCANLGEIVSRTGLPVPDGFVLTTSAFQTFFKEAGLWEEIGRVKLGLVPEDPASVGAACEEIQRAVLTAPLPKALTGALYAAFDDLAGRTGVPPGELGIALRSSAIGEDGDMSFAGQYLTMLNVGRDRLETSYKYVMASLFTPRAVTYRALAGIPDEAAAMAAGCLSMVPARAAGVMYTRDPVKPREESLLINALWGLGAQVVDGLADPDAYAVSRPGTDGAGPAVRERRIAHKTLRLAAGADGRINEEPVTGEDSDAPCLSDEDVLVLASMGLALEAHFGRPQDVEWAKTSGGRFLILQSRPLGTFSTAGRPALPEAKGHETLCEGGETAQPGVGAGPVFPVRGEEDLERFPKGAVLVAAHSSPSFMAVLPRTAAIVTERGAVTGHMASLCREFRVPALLGAAGAMSLPEGQEVTVDAWSGKIYRGRVQELLDADGAEGFSMKGSEIYAILERLSRLIVPLRLTDPKSPRFTEENCGALHDVARYLHEKSYAEMFRLSDAATGRGGEAVSLDAPTGLDLCVIDLGGGLTSEARGKRRVKPDMVTSGPFAALLDGLVLSDPSRAAARPVHAGGFLSVMREQMLSNPQAGDERFGDKSYAIISDKYLNFSSRVGYHYGVLDCYMGNTVNKNYVSFSFKGGAADDVKRSRRARGIANILTQMGFSVDTAGDRVAGRYHKAKPEEIRGVLAEMGRLLQFTRQTDMLMVDEGSVEEMARVFFTGAYAFDPQARGNGGN